MRGFAELEVSLHRRDSGSYTVDFRFSQPDSDADNRLVPGAAPQFSTSFDELQNLAHNPVGYGEKLTEDFFSDPSMKDAFTQALNIAESKELSLRIRLLIGPTAPELQNLRWELLNNPRDGGPLCTDENILFSRYLSSLDWRPVRLRPKSSLTALAFIANPSDLADNNLASVDVAGEYQRARDGLGRIPVDLVPQPDTDQRASLDNLLDVLRHTEYDILYLVAHGYMGKDNEPRLVLEDETTGKVVITSGSDLATRLKELTHRPRLVVLASCQSAGNSAGDALRALGPRLAEAGISAVIAMQGNISMETTAEFMPKFFKELTRDGQIDRAMAVARGEVWDVHKHPDFWMPALFMRLKSGRIWYVPGFGEGTGGFEKWKAIGRFIKSSQCTPILGPGLYESMLGSQREIAQRWAEEFHYPMAPHERESLPQVAQFLTVNQYQRAPYDELAEYLQSVVKERYKDDLTGEDENSSLDQMIEIVSAKMRQSNPYEPHEALAKLPLPIYITTNPGNQMAAALKDAQKDPQVVLCPWNEYTEKAYNNPEETIYARESDYHPTPERPLVYHLFGRLNEPDSVVLTEDDYFDFLIGVTRNNKLIPNEVRAALADTALLFLGFKMDEWNFRVLFRSILSQQGSVRRGLYAHIAAQIEPEEGRILEPERARRYLENYFSQGADISLYWGSPEDFIKELLNNWDPNSR
jgi:hypothetical protein